LGPEFLPKKLRESLQKIRDDLKNLPEKAGAVVKPVRQVKMLRMLEPKIEEDFKPFEKKRTGDKTLLEEQKLRHKIKQERKGARKEIRKDVAFLAVQKAKERRQKDDDRRLKTKSLMASLANQEGDFQTIQRKKKKF
jgi:nucleolar protein 14